MILYEEWRSQLDLLFNSNVLQSWALCQEIHLDDKTNALSLRLRPTHRLQEDTKRVEKKSLDHIQLCLTYSKIYNEPLLLLRIWEEKCTENILLTKLMFPAKVESLLGVEGKFQLGLDTVIDLENSLWYSFHPCDTPNIVGDLPEFKSTYLRRWVSIFVFSWLGYEGA
ncbi:E2-like conjugating enzyme SKDI_12G0170 [Saccharomyces kudriavzevii IFO 1802]|uniref:ATG10-like protein n=1 Tax=Saccharomyces kudriavzevii (strain ATCC MYA-4449 / AS 2.2408 / CBS 8840 / NBRC 1802 / NCYC 2889) TaxID=226230 RepID=A0AA35J3G0_SACK1|nr:uncharacterized protein SKDI_12G0170 [Saccharomyces kudriavzevii IFO 1802]CAI4045586.1 hypothetical protein SKDI_12G0170 [Saccharomyces kudriavzevii IFO 1802]